MLASTLLPPCLREHPGHRAATTTRHDPDVHYWLGPAGRCTGQPKAFLFAPDDSGSVTSAGGNDPLSRRYAEARLAFRRLARACTCGHEHAAILHWDTSPLDVPPVRLDTHGLARLATGLHTPGTPAGTSDLGPVLERATTLARRLSRRHVQPHLIIASDFEITDPHPDHILDRLSQFATRWTATALILGGHPGTQLTNQPITTIQITPDDPPGTAAHALFDILTTGRPHHHTKGQP